MDNLNATLLSEIEFHIQKRKQERNKLQLCWQEIKKLNVDSKLSRDCYLELKARISSRLAFIEKSILDHERLL